MIDVSPSSSCHRRRTHRGLWLTGPDELSRDRLVRLRWECDGDGVPHDVGQPKHKQTQ